MGSQLSLNELRRMRPDQIIPLLPSVDTVTLQQLTNESIMRHVVVREAAKGELRKREMPPRYWPWATIIGLALAGLSVAFAALRYFGD